jgi:hypothetical protein
MRLGNSRVPTRSGVNSALMPISPFLCGTGWSGSVGSTLTPSSPSLGLSALVRRPCLIPSNMRRRVSVTRARSRGCGGVMFVRANKAWISPRLLSPCRASRSEVQRQRCGRTQRTCFVGMSFPGHAQSRGGVYCARVIRCYCAMITSIIATEPLCWTTTEPARFGPAPNLLPGF